MFTSPCCHGVVSADGPRPSHGPCQYQESVLHRVVLFEVPEHTAILKTPIARAVELSRGNPLKMDDLDRRHDVARKSQVFDAVGEIDVVEEERKLLVEEAACAIDDIPPEKAEGSAGLLNLLDP